MNDDEEDVMGRIRRVESKWSPRFALWPSRTSRARSHGVDGCGHDDALVPNHHHYDDDNNDDDNNDDLPAARLSLRSQGGSRGASGPSERRRSCSWDTFVSIFNPNLFIWNETRTSDNHMINKNKNECQVSALAPETPSFQSFHHLFVLATIL